MKSMLDSLTTINTALAGLGVGGAAGGAGYAPKTTSGAGTIVPAEVLSTWSQFQAKERADTAASLVFNQTNNINGSTSSSDITTATIAAFTVGQTQGLMSNQTSQMAMT